MKSQGVTRAFSKKDETQGSEMAVIATGNAGAPEGSYRPERQALPSFVAAVPKFHDGSDTPRHFLERCLERIDARDGEVQAFVCIDRDAARAAADAATRRYCERRVLSPIDGCPIGVKDNVETVDLPTQMNSPIFAGWRSGRDAACVLALRTGGAVIVGKTALPEFCMGHSGPTRNPFDLERTPGGSSSGSGAAVGAGMVPSAIGNQTGGSLIRPASFNGVYGFKPSHGALNVGGMHPIAPSQDHIGTMSATLADAWLTAQQIAARAGGSGGQRAMAGSPQLGAAVKPQRLVHLKTLGWPELDGASMEAFDRLRSLLCEQGVQLVDASADRDIAQLETLLEEASRIGNDIIMYEAKWPLLAYLEARPGSLGARTMERLSRGVEMSEADYHAALDARDVIRRQVVRVAADGSCFLTLASSGPAPRGHADTGSRSFLSPWSMIGGPSLSLPLFSVDAMPLGAQLMGMPGSDVRTVGVARYLDELVRG
jgi:Asp-tRNA(Asn)/Glu-tRNA(Gln) amidotransferase A subunit family amidase